MEQAEAIRLRRVTATKALVFGRDGLVGLKIVRLGDRRPSRMVGTDGSIRAGLFDPDGYTTWVEKGLKAHCANLGLQSSHGHSIWRST